MSINSKSLILPLFFFYCFTVSLKVNAEATKPESTIELTYQQTQNFWSILSQIQDGSNTIESAQSLLNQTYGKPAGAQIGIRYSSQEALRELRFDSVGYAVSSNPVLPRLFGWAGYGPEATIGFSFFELYCGRYWGRRADAVSTDLIDRRLIEKDIVTYWGLGLHVDQDLEKYFSLPTKAKLKTRSTNFSSSRGETQWYHRWRVGLESDFTSLVSEKWPQLKGLLIAGPQPVPSFENQSRIWDYLWRVAPDSDLFAMLGLGAQTIFENLSHLTFTGGFFGGYFGAEISVMPFERFSIGAQTYGIETSAAYRAQEIRFWGANLKYDL